MMASKVQYIYFITYTFIILCVITLQACQPQTAAKISLRSHQSSESYPDYQKLSSNPYKATVSSRDTVYSIAQANQVSLRDLIDQNDLRPPYTLGTGQILKLPKAQFHIAQKGDTLFAISRSYGVDLHSLAKTNNISSKDRLLSGHKIRIPHVSYEQVKSAKKTKSNVKAVYENVSLSTKMLSEKRSDPLSPNPYSKQAKSLTQKPKQKTVARSAKGFIWPTQGAIISKFGPKKGGLYNDGINISAREGTIIKAASGGQVVYSGNELSGYGNLLLIKHNNGYLTAYAHTKKTLVKKGDHVSKGQVIGYVGKTGHVSKPQLHFSIRKGRKAINPSSLLKG